jgi:SNF2 family DNA or RNA helicase
MTENDLHQYQLQAVDHIISHTHCALFLDMGLGKTVSTLTAINELMFKEVEVRRVLVIAPKRVAESVWTQEVEKWDHLKHIKVSRIIGTERQRREALAKKADVYTIGQRGLAMRALRGILLTVRHGGHRRAQQFQEPQVNQIQSS